MKEKKEVDSGRSWWCIGEVVRKRIGCLIGDFNNVRRTCERKRVGGIELGRRERTDFNNFIDNTELEDVSLLGRKFTWLRPSGTTRSRIDRA